MTKIFPEESAPAIVASNDEVAPDEAASVEIETINEPAPVDQSSSCSHRLGYLCQRENKSNIPDECMLCKDIVPCMLGTLKK